MASWFRPALTEIIDEAAALPGRDTPLAVSGVHFVTGDSYLPPYPEGSDILYVAMGCFWGAERIFWELDGVITTAVGYMGGFTPNPTYEEVCTGRTGHAEAVRVVYDPERVDVETLLAAFWENHDPTQRMRQGNDVGTQYRSAIYATSEDQAAVAGRSRQRYQASLSRRGFGKIATTVEEAGPFYFAEEGHQQYLAKNPAGYCNHGFCQVAYGE